MQQTIRRLRNLHLAYLSRPAALRRMYRQIRRTGATRILEIGLESPQRAKRMIEVAARGRPTSTVSYTAIDLFEMRPDTSRPGMSLRLAFRELRSTGACIHLYPGEVSAVLARKSNDLLNRDLILISDEQDSADLAGAWFYLPRMLHRRSVVFQSESFGNGSPPSLRQLSHAEVSQLAESCPERAA